MKTSVKGIARRALACVCSVALAAALVPAVALNALAADSSSEETVLTVTVKDAETGDELTPKGWEYTESELKALAAQNTTTVNYLSGAKGGRVYSSSCYVTAEQLLSGSIKWASGATVDVIAADGLTVTKTYDELTADQYYYPDYTLSGKEGTNAVKVEPALLITSACTNITGTAADAAATNATLEQETTMTWFMGMTSASEDLPSGKSQPRGVVKITLTYPHSDFTILAKNANTGETTQVKSLTTSELFAIAKTDAANYLISTKSVGVHSTTSYVPLNSLLSTYAEDMWRPGSSVNVAAPDAFSTDISYEDATAKQYFYPNYTGSEGSSLDGAVAVEPVIALNYNSGSIGTDGETAADVAAANKAKSFTSGTRFFKGVIDIDSIPGGKTSVTNCDTLTVTYVPATTQKVTKGTWSKTYKAKKLAKSAKSFKISAKAKTAVTYKVTKISKSAKKHISISKAGKVTVKKGTKKGTYKATVKATAAADATYASASATKTVTVKVK